jgi:oligopeptide transport system substrate-binding protein
MRKLSKFAALAITFILTALLFGCGGGSAPPASDTGGTANTPAADDEQVLNLSIGTFNLFDTNEARYVGEWQVLRETNEGLFRIITDANGDDYREFAGATDYSVSDDGLVYTFKLRKDAVWSDGVPVTAQQYVDAVVRLLDPEQAFTYNTVAYDIKNAQAYFNGEAEAQDVGVRAVDDYTLEITLERLTPFFLTKLTAVSFFPIRLELIEAANGSWGDDLGPLVFNGPFIVTDWVKENSLTLERNPTFWDADNVKLQKVTFTSVPELSTQAQLLKNKQLDAVQGASEYDAQWKADVESGILTYHETNDSRINFVAFNHHTGGPSGLTQNAKIREALSLAISREELNELVFGNLNFPGYSLYPYGSKSGTIDFRATVAEPLKPIYDSYNQDSAKLQALFKEGLAELGKSDDLSAVSLAFVTTVENEQDSLEQEYLRQTWESVLGVHIDLKVLADFGLYADSVINNNYDLLIGSVEADYEDPIAFADLWISTSTFTGFYGGYASPGYDALYQSLSGVADEAARAKIYEQLETLIIAKDFGIAPLYYTNPQTFVQSYVKDIYITSYGAHYEFAYAYIQGK